MNNNPRSQGMSLPVHRNDETSPLLARPQGVEQQPFSRTISIIQLLRIPIIPIAIADIVLMANCHDYIFLGVLLECVPVGLCLWTLFAALEAPDRTSNISLEFTIGDSVLSLGRKNQSIDPISQPKTRPSRIIWGDFLASALLILLTVLSLATHILQYDVRWRVFSLTLALVCLQLVLAVSNFFTLFRNAKITVHMPRNI